MKRVIYYGLPDRSFVMINPEITLKSVEKFWVWDSCFSVNSAFFVEILRHERIRVEYRNEHGKLEVNEFMGDLSELVQHETDHLLGILATDHLTDNRRIILRQEWERMKAR